MSAPANVSTAVPAARAGVRPWTAIVVVLTGLLAIGIGAVLASFLLENRAGPQAFAMADSIPADAPLVYELRLDLPGGQAAALDQLLTHFPAEASDAIADGNLERWIDEQLEGTGLPYRFATDVKPWFDGRVTVALLEMPSMMTTTDTMPEAPRFAVLVGTRDREATAAFIDRVRSDAEAEGTAFESETYEGVEIWTQTEPDPVSGMALTWALDGDRLIVTADRGDAREMLDVNAGRAENIAASDEYRRVSEALAPDAVASFVVNTEALVAAGIEDLRSMPDMEPVAAVYERLAGAAGLAGGSVTIQPDGLRIETAAIVSEELPVPANAERGLDGQVPGDAIFFVDGGRVGELLAWYITAVKEGLPEAGTSPEFNRETIADVEAALGSDLESFVSWIDDAALVAGWDGSQPYGGAILATDDIESARQRIGQLRALGEMGAAQAGISISEEQIAGVAVVTIRFPADGASGLPIEPVVQYAIDDTRVLIGVGDRFVRRVLEMGEGDALAASDRYRAARDSVGPASNQAVGWLDLAALREAIVPNLPPEVRTGYDEYVAGWVEPLDYLVGVTRAEGDLSVSVSEITVR